MLSSNRRRSACSFWCFLVVIVLAVLILGILLVLVLVDVVADAVGIEVMVVAAGALVVCKPPA